MAAAKPCCGGQCASLAAYDTRVLQLWSDCIRRTDIGLLVFCCSIQHGVGSFRADAAALCHQLGPAGVGRASDRVRCRRELRCAVQRRDAARVVRVVSASRHGHGSGQCRRRRPCRREDVVAPATGAAGCQRRAPLPRRRHAAPCAR